MADPIRWLALGYSVPVNPSKTVFMSGCKLKSTAQNILNRVLRCSHIIVRATPSLSIFLRKFWRWGERLRLLK